MNSHIRVNFPQRASFLLIWSDFTVEGRTEQSVLLGNSRSRQSRGCVEAELSAPSTALSSPTPVVTCSPLPETEDSSAVWTRQLKEPATKSNKSSVSVRQRRAMRTPEQEKQTECFRSCWTLVNLIAFATMHYCKANRETVSCAGGASNRLMAQREGRLRPTFPQHFHPTETLRLNNRPAV